MKTFMETFKEEPFATLFFWFMILFCVGTAVVMWIIPFGFGYEWWMIPINLVISAVCGTGAFFLYDAWRDLTTSYYD